MIVNPKDQAYTLSSMKNYAFIDSQNLNLGVKSAGWTLDFGKFRLYLKNKYSVTKAYLFIGQMAGNESLYDHLQSMGYHLIFKPTTAYKVNGKIMIKVNVDAELVLYAAAKVIEEYDKALIVTGDGDFQCLVKYLRKIEKLGYVISPNSKWCSILLKREARSSHVFIEEMRSKLELK